MFIDRFHSQLLKYRRFGIVGLADVKRKKINLFLYPKSYNVQHSGGNWSATSCKQGQNMQTPPAGFIQRIFLLWGNSATQSSAPLLLTQSVSILLVGNKTEQSTI